MQKIDTSSNSPNFVKLRFPKFIILDWDNTLVGCEYVFGEVIKMIDEEMKKRGFTTFLQDIEPHLQSSDRFIPAPVMFKGIFKNNWREILEVHNNCLKQIHLRDIELKKYAMTFLEAVYKSNIPMAVVSNKASEFLHPEIAKFGLQKFFRRVIGVGDTLGYKPDPEPVFEAVASVIPKNSPISEYEKVWLIGDSLIDLGCAENMPGRGCKPIIVCDEADISTKREIMLSSKKSRYIVISDLLKLTTVYHRVMEANGEIVQIPIEFL